MKNHLLLTAVLFVLGLPASFASYFQQIDVKSDTVSTAQVQEVQPEPVKPVQTAPAVEEVAVVPESVVADTASQEAIVVQYYQTEEPKEEGESAEKEDKMEKKDEIRTISGSKNQGGGYGGVGVKISSFNKESLAMLGVRGAWVINRALAFGADIWGVIPTSEYNSIPNLGVSQVNLVGGYGGIILEPIVLSNQVIHVTFPVSAGAGWLGYVPDMYSDLNSGDLLDDDVFWYVEPGAAVELNLSRAFRLNFAVSKRFTQDLRLIGTEHDEFDDWNYTLMMKIGRF
ncbi:hypothetical protein BFP72_03895 [Reichenbachiella sp. 5M10]|uniref:hypothetical protein n=1 Tax=Reichenbachiella sp. 5M10 TaxID=1889772 RepID=UPI000C14DB75|nr:hypothetical protein [Reichenbachiella sp. 5M10]PIB34610.1 hypothetical protein BFP72_03895 [Reichenbachiella sp. 5M10]